MNEHVTVQVDTELLAELENWSEPLMVKLIRTPQSKTGWELIFRRSWADQFDVPDEFDLDEAIVSKALPTELVSDLRPGGGL